MSSLLRLDDEGITFDDPFDGTRRIRWDDLLEVSIETTDEGPFLEDVFFVLTSADGECKIPQECPGTDELLTWLQRLPGFDNEAVIRAMMCTDYDRFLCWRK